MATTRVRSARTARPKPVRSCRLARHHGHQFLTLTVDGETTDYRITEVPSDFGRGFTLDKLAGDTGAVEDTYTVHLGQPTECECKGFQRWQHCKHVESLIALTECGRI